jgi:ubiquinone/menaquinone biosynthesis C-methylase UbiE
MTNAEIRQLDYYRESASTYDAMHTASFDEHLFALRHIAMYLSWIDARSVLDTGCGTGRSMRYLKELLPEIEIRGNDPSAPLLDVAHKRNGIPREALDETSSEQLPYRDGAFDAVVETGVLHHVSDAKPVVAEMLRVARKAVFLSDTNIYGQGRASARIAKLVLARIALLKPINRVRRGGHDWYFSDGDGVAYSYSVFDSLRQVAATCDRVLVIPTVAQRCSTWIPILGCTHALVCGFKKSLPNERAMPSEGELLSSWPSYGWATAHEHSRNEKAND